VGAQDRTTVWSTGAEGHYTRQDANAFTINARKDSNSVWGYSETPETSVIITLRSGTTTKAAANLTSSSSGYYHASFSNNGTPVNIAQGDTVQVQTGDGSDTTLAIPELTLDTDAASNLIRGRGPANQLIRTELRRHFNMGYYSHSENASANSAGNYSAAYSGLYWSRDCSPIRVGSRCAQPVVTYYNPASHRISLEGRMPPAAPADAYESNNTAATATPYSGVQTHTFHAGDDVDWIRFVVPVADAANGVSYRIDTFNLGWDMAMDVALYDAAMTHLGSWTGYESRGRGVSITWTPTASGTYYLRISPPSALYTSYCDAYYDVRVLPVRGRVYLPLAVRNY
jgi:hypothetical protein